MDTSVRALGAAALVLVTATAWPVLADDDGDEPLLHGHRSWELGFQAGYAQAAGKLRSDGNETVVTTGPGGAFGLDLGYRGNPFVTIGASGAFEMFAPMQEWYSGSAEDRMARGLSLGLDVDLHPSPTGRISPWFGLGIGYRLLWVPQPADAIVLEHGPELFRLNGGVDFVAAKGVAVGPWAGADLMLITWRENDTIETGLPVFFQLGVRTVLNFESIGREEPPPVRIAR